MKDLTRERWQRIEAVLDQVLELPPAQRIAWLESTCDDPALRADVEKLLAAEARAGNFLEEPPWSGAVERAHAAVTGEKQRKPSGDDTTALGARFGPWKVVSMLGRGGMGAVYLAERADGSFQQQVALKIVRHGMDSGDILRRFIAERQILANLRHPSIAGLVDGGQAADGRPWFAMELVEGDPITTYCDVRRLGIDERIRLFKHVCDAVRAAHRAHVIHRDIKPSNILITRDGHVQLLDFGISKQLPSDGTDVTLTGVWQRMLTPEYASPEQVRGEVTSRATDIYALGIVLYELLTGQRAQSVAADRPGDVVRVICEQDPDPPSVVIERQPLAALARSTDPKSLQRTLRGGLDATVMKALRKLPSDRYATVDHMLDDLERALGSDRHRDRHWWSFLRRPD
ncbi:MAG: serine/threonine-protein kinase [Longimicrobiales bacterium]